MTTVPKSFAVWDSKKLKTPVYKFLGQVMKWEFGQMRNAAGELILDRDGKEIDNLTVEIRNLTRAMEFDYREFYTPGTSPNSKWGQYITACEKAKVPVSMDVSEGAQHIYWFEEKEVAFGSAKPRRWHYPVGKATPEEIRAALDGYEALAEKAAEDRMARAAATSDEVEGVAPDSPVEEPVDITNLLDAYGDDLLAVALGKSKRAFGKAVGDKFKDNIAICSSIAEIEDRMVAEGMMKLAKNDDGVEVYVVG
jgi:hypothetical protein